MPNTAQSALIGRDMGQPVYSRGCVPDSQQGYVKPCGYTTVGGLNPSGEPDRKCMWMTNHSPRTRGHPKQQRNSGILGVLRIPTSLDRVGETSRVQGDDIFRFFHY